MKKIVHFFKSSYLVILGFAIGAMLVTVSALTIPTNIDNAIQTIKTIYISTDGVSTTGNNVVVKIDNVSGAALTVIGNITVGDKGNSVFGQWSSVAGGLSNYLTGDYSIILGGSSNRINANRSAAMGRNAEALHDNTFVWSDDSGGPFQSTTGRTFLIRARRGVAIGTGATFGMTSLRVWDGTTGRIGAEEYCDENGTGCIDADSLGGGGYWSKSGSNIYNNNTGKVGIGTSSPNGALEFANVSADRKIVLAKSANDNYQFYGFGISPNTLIYQVATQASNHVFYAGDGTTGSITHELMRIQGDGNVGIGTNGPTETLDLSGSLRVRDIPYAASSNNVLVSNGSGKVYYALVSELSVGGNTYWSGNGADIYNTNTGNMGIGTDSPTVALQVSGNAIIGNTNNIIDVNVTYSSILGGASNIIYSGVFYSNIGGGRLNTIWGNFSTIGGGQQNKIYFGADGAIIGGGINNQIFSGADYSTIGGGYQNNIYSGVSFGGATYSTIGGGHLNNIYSSADHSTIGGGQQNNIYTGASYGTIGGGLLNNIYASSDYSIIGGGRNNKIYDGTTYSIIGGGSDNKIYTGSTYSSIGGGTFNEIYTGSIYSNIGGGNTNRIYSLVQGSTIGGGRVNSIYDGAGDSTIGGGIGNTIYSGNYQSTIGGGDNNIIYNGSVNSTIPGGSQNGIRGDYSFAAGRRAHPNADGMFVWADSTNADFSGNIANSFIVRAAGGVGINLTDPGVYALNVNGSAGGTTAWTNYSDSRYKKDIVTIPNALDKILTLNGVYFDWKKIEGKDFAVGKQIGLIAQNVEKVFPEAVLTDKQGYKSLAYASLVSPIIEAIKELYTHYVDQQTKIDDLEARVEKLEKLMNAK